MNNAKVPVAGLSFVDRASGEDKTEAARAIMQEKAPELLELMAQVKALLPPSTHSPPPLKHPSTPPIVPPRPSAQIPACYCCDRQR